MLFSSPTLRAFLACSFVTLVGSVGACASTGRTTFDDEDAGGDAAPPAPTTDSSAPPIFTDASLDARPPAGPAAVFGHSGKTLYKLDPDTKAIAVIGDFAGCTEQVIDIALDEKSVMYGTTYSGLYRIETATAKCTKVADAPATKSFPNSLSFVPKGSLDPATEALVGYVGSDYVRIEPQTGVLTTIGKLEPTGKLISSGDIVSVIDGPTYLTVKATGATGQCSASDCLVEVDPKTGAISKNWGELKGQADVFGVAFWGGSIYGFTKTGVLFEVVPKNNMLTLNEITIPSKPADLSFFGAGSTTSAPVQPK